MAISCDVRTELTLTGLEVGDLVLAKKFTVGTVPTAYNNQRRTLAVADTEEALDLGDVAATSLIWLYAIDGDIYVDCDFVTAFDADLEIKSGTCNVFSPVGTVYVKNADAAETPSYLYAVIGTT